MNDFARLSTGKKVGIFVGIAVLVSLLYFRFILKGLNDDLEEAEAGYQAAVSALGNAEKDVGKYDELKQKMKEDAAKAQRNRTALPTDSQVGTFFTTLRRKATEAGVELKYTRKPEEPVEGFVRVPMDVEISGGFMQIKRFFAALVPKPPTNTPGDKQDPADRIVSVENLVLTQPAVKTKEPVLTAKFIAVTYRLADAPAPGAGSGSSAEPIRPAGVAPPTQTTTNNTSSAPMPSAATPAGAKARTDDAMKKEEQNVKKANDAGEGSGVQRLKGGQ